jgi:hypothetical protein
MLENSMAYCYQQLKALLLYVLENEKLWKIN